jgi:hypothetical protein
MSKPSRSVRVKMHHISPSEIYFGWEQGCPTPTGHKAETHTTGSHLLSLCIFAHFWTPKLGFKLLYVHCFFLQCRLQTEVETSPTVLTPGAFELHYYLIKCLALFI